VKRHSHLKIAVLALVALAGVVFWVLSDEGGSGDNPRAAAVATGGHEDAGSGNAIVSAQGKAAAPALTSRTRPHSKEEEILLKSLIASFRSLLIERENRRTTFLWEQKRGSGHTNAICVRAPSVGEIGEIAVKMSETLKQAPEEVRGELRAALQNQYDRYTNFPRASQVLYVTRIDGVSTAKLIVDHVDDVSSIKASEDGSIRLLGSWHEEPFEINNVPESGRYSHILLNLPPLP
jgi:hypothetical protein